MSPEINGDEPATKRDIERVIELVVQLHQELDRRFADVDRRLESMERRMDRFGETLFGIQSQMGAVTKWADRLDRDNHNLIATQAAQQRAIDELAVRVTKLERQQ